MRRFAPALLLSFAVATAAPLSQDRRQGALRPGDPAIDFTLEPRGGGTPITLSAFRGRCAVALVFGSYT